MGGIPGNFPWTCATHFFKSGPYFSLKNVIFYTCFQTQPLKSIPVFRAAIGIELRPEFKQDFLKSILNSHITLSFGFSWN